MEEKLPSIVLVPDDAGKMFDDAKNQLMNIDFIVDSKYESSSKLLDTVLSSNPLPGISAEKRI